MTAPQVEQELRTNTMNFLRFRTAVESKRLKIKLPPDTFLEAAEKSAASVGDSFLLSETDMNILALALEIKASGNTPKIISDDYSIQNVATQLGIEFASLATFGIRRLLKWVRYCPACHKEYSVNYRSDECDICGTTLKRKPMKKPKPMSARPKR